jgi:8-oxo-dGTP pyrophosphatase MutT (NUDIX family)
MLVIQNSAKKYLLQFRDGHAPHHPLEWDFFGGGDDPGEGPGEGAGRELEEELNIVAGTDELQRIASFIHAERTDFEVVLVRYSRPVEWGDFRVLEGAGAGYFNAAELMRLPVSPKVRQAIEKIVEME